MGTMQNRQGSVLETADGESILEVVALDEQGSQLLLRNQSAFADHIRPILKDIHDKIRCTFAAIGSWPAQQFAHTCRESDESVGPDLECMVANDIDCFFGEPGNGHFAMEGMPRKELINDHEVNWVKVIISVMSCRILKDSDMSHCVRTYVRTYPRSSSLGATISKHHHDKFLMCNSMDISLITQKFHA